MKGMAEDLAQVMGYHPKPFPHIVMDRATWAKVKKTYPDEYGGEMAVGFDEEGRARDETIGTPVYTDGCPCDDPPCDGSGSIRQ